MGRIHNFLTHRLRDESGHPMEAEEVTLEGEEGADARTINVKPYLRRVRGFRGSIAKVLAGEYVEFTSDLDEVEANKRVFVSLKGDEAVSIEDNSGDVSIAFGPGDIVLDPSNEKFGHRIKTGRKTIPMADITAPSQGITKALKLKTAVIVTQPRTLGGVYRRMYAASNGEEGDSAKKSSETAFEHEVKEAVEAAIVEEMAQHSIEDIVGTTKAEVQAAPDPTTVLIKPKTNRIKSIETAINEALNRTVAQAEAINAADPDAHAEKGVAHTLGVNLRVEIKDSDLTPELEALWRKKVEAKQAVKTEAELLADNLLLEPIRLSALQARAARELAEQKHNTAIAEEKAAAATAEFRAKKDLGVDPNTLEFADALRKTGAQVINAGGLGQPSTPVVFASRLGPGEEKHEPKVGQPLEKPEHIGQAVDGFLKVLVRQGIVDKDEQIERATQFLEGIEKEVKPDALAAYIRSKP